MVARIKPAKAPLLVCPFTGRPLEIRRVGGGLLWVASCSDPDGGWSTRMFDSKEELLYFVSKRGGVSPAFSKQGSHFEVQLREPPRDESPGDQGGLDDKVSEFVDRIVDSRR